MSPIQRTLYSSRIILAPDGDFNVAINNREELTGFVKRKHH
jgi:hypothetical protein